MKRIIIILIAVSTFTGLNAQKSGFSFLYGQGTYNCAELKSYQDELAALMPVTPVETSNFPMYTALKITYFKENPQQIKYGVILGAAFTGAHSNYTDFSGYLDLNQTLSAYHLGISGSYPFIQLPRFDIGAYGNLSLSYLRNEVSKSISLTNYYWEKSTLSLRAISPYTEIGLEANIHLNNYSFGLEAGYLYDIGGTLKYPKEAIGNPESILIPSNDLKSQMSGFRAGIKIIFWINSELIFE